MARDGRVCPTAANGNRSKDDGRMMAAALEGRRSSEVATAAAAAATGRRLLNCEYGRYSMALTGQDCIQSLTPTTALFIHTTGVTRVLGDMRAVFHSLPDSDCGCLVVVVWYTESFLMTTSRDYHVYIPNSYTRHALLAHEKRH